MAYTLNQYYSLTFSNPNAPRIVVYPNNSVAASLLSHHKTPDVPIIALSDCVADGADKLPMPNDIIDELKRKILECNERASIVAIDSYLSLLDKTNIMAFWVAMQGILDSAETNAIFFVSSNSFPANLFSPQYSESRKILQVSGDFENLDSPKVIIVSDKWVKSGDAFDYRTLLERFGNFMPTGEHIVVLKDLHVIQAGLNKAVSFLFDIKQIAERFYGISEDLEPSTLESLLISANKSELTPESYLETEFGKSNIDSRLALKRLLDLPNDDIWTAYIWLLLKRLPSNSYLVEVLSSGITQGNLLRKYVVDTAISVLDDAEAKKIATERASAIVGLSVESLIVEFIGQTKDLDSALKFLNCGTTAERIELIRRASKFDLTVGLPEMFALLYPTLADYLSAADYGLNDVTSYFNEYRKLKVNSSVTEGFVNKAYEFSVPHMFLTREAILSELRTDDTALLVVDGMGAEYFPLLLAMARRRNMNLEAFAIASVKLPTSTGFNHIAWDKGRVLDEIKNIDNIAHYGAVKHEKCSPEQNIEAVLWVFETEVFTRIAEGLSKFSRIVVTADHGASRLAVLAHENGMSTTLAWKVQPDDWRYSIAPVGEACSADFEQVYFPESQKDYWVIRGYHRLPKSGGKPNELHGGASLEERLVPVVVFTRNTTILPQEQATKRPIEDLIDEFEDTI